MESNLLKAKMVLRGKSVNEICDDLGISRAAWYRKMTGASDFTRSEISAIAESLSLDESELVSIFFNDHVA